MEQSWQAEHNAEHKFPSPPQPLSCPSTCDGVARSKHKAASKETLLCQKAHLPHLSKFTHRERYPKNKTKKKNVSFNNTWAWGHKTERTCEQDPSIFHKSLEVRKSCSSLPSFLHKHPANPIYTCFRRFFFYVGICLGKKKKNALSIVALQITM